MKRKKHTLLCLLLAAAFVSGCAQKHKEGEPDVISSMKMNQDEILTVVANRNQIEDKEDFAKFLVEKCKDNSFQSVRFSTDYGYATSSGMTGGMNVALKNLVYNMYSLDLSKKISSAMQTRMKNGTRLPVNARYGYRKGKDGRLEVDPDAAKVVKMIFQMAAEGLSFAEITRELNKQEIATCDEQKMSRGEQVQFRRFDTIMKKRWNPTTVSAIIRDEIYIGSPPFSRLTLYKALQRSCLFHR